MPSTVTHVTEPSFERTLTRIQPGGGYIPPNASGGYAPPPGPAYAGTTHLGEDEEAKGYEFTDQTIRRAFIRKVYGILMCQLLVTVVFIAVFLYHEPTKLYVQRHRALFWVAFAVMIVTLLAMACCTNVRRKAPMNFVFLFLFTAAESFMLAMAASTYNKEEVIFAAGITAGVCFGLTLFAMQTRFDFTAMGGVLMVAVLVLLLFGIFAAIFRDRITTIVYASCGALIFSLYLVYDTQLMMGGKHKYSLSPEEYIFAALNLYLDVINIFMYILTIIGYSNK